MGEETSRRVAAAAATYTRQTEAKTDEHLSHRSKETRLRNCGKRLFCHACLPTYLPTSLATYTHVGIFLTTSPFILNSKKAPLTRAKLLQPLILKFKTPT